MSIIIPEFTLHTVLGGLRDKLKDDSLWGEPTLIDDTGLVSGPSQRQLDDFREKLRTKKLNVGFIYPQTLTELPAITIVPESWGTSQALLGEMAGIQGRVLTVVTDEVVVASAAGGELGPFQLDHLDLVPQSWTVKKNGTELSLGFTVSRTAGTLTLTTALVLNDSLTISYTYYGEDPVDLVGEISRQETRLFIEESHPEALLILVALVWRELMLKRQTLEMEGGMKNLALSVVALSEWRDVLPTVAFRREMLLSYEVDHVAGVRLPPPPKEVVLQFEQPLNTVVASIRDGVES